MHTERKIIAFGVTAIAGVAFLFLFGFRWIVNDVLHDGHMHFPLTPHGQFASPPTADVSGFEPVIRWRTSGKCLGNAYQVVTDDYVEDKQWDSWSGGMAACESVEGSKDQNCHAINGGMMGDLLAKGKTLWFVAEGHQCEGPDESRSSPVLILRK